MPTLFLVGDSTVCYYDLTKEDLNFLRPRNGYGMWLDRYFCGGLNVCNLALSGRSSKSFLQEENYKTLLSSIKEGDFLLIDFSHNDQKFKDETRFTFGAGEVGDKLSFKYYLYNYYVKIAQDAKATPILCTAIVRRSETGEYVGDRVHSIGEVSCYGKTFAPSDYSQSIRDLGKSLGVTVVDLTTATKEYYQKAGVCQTAKLHATLSGSADNTDNTHLNSFGAGVVAGIFAKELAKTDCPLKNFLRAQEFAVTQADLFENKL